jgi:hypothetical protein
LTRRADPERIYQARRDAVRNRLTDEHRMPPELADQWLRAWEVEAADRGLERLRAEYWDGASEWVVEQRSARKAPLIRGFGEG